ncbi:MAG: type II toxin-antitoxin system RelE/ParE family toxin [Methanimicrococcus sp.]|nr:type II toxin-antitoxin system RelE/ParE family toxin [Methanimicrococcus sp.]
MKTKYKVRYLPTHEQDVAAVMRYIKYKIQNTAAAERLFDDMNQAVAGRLYSPLSYKPYFSKNERKIPYYRIRVRNYVIYYVVIDDVVELRRFVYNRRNIGDIV